MEKAQGLLTEIFGAFRQARKDGSKKAFEILQDKLAEHAGALVGADLSSVKELVDTLMKLDGVAKEDEGKGGSAELAVQAFLRGQQSEEITQ